MHFRQGIVCSRSNFQCSPFFANNGFLWTQGSTLGSKSQENNSNLLSQLLITSSNQEVIFKCYVSLTQWLVFWLGEHCCVYISHLFSWVSSRWLWGIFWTHKKPKQNLWFFVAYCRRPEAWNEKKQFLTFSNVCLVPGWSTILAQEILTNSNGFLPAEFFSTTIFLSLSYQT